jgi:hypothetical protein
MPAMSREQEAGSGDLDQRFSPGLSTLGLLLCERQNTQAHKSSIVKTPAIQVFCVCIWSYSWPFILLGFLSCELVAKCRFLILCLLDFKGSKTHILLLLLLFPVPWGYWCSLPDTIQSSFQVTWKASSWAH